jgi:hypothetical protein
MKCNIEATRNRNFLLRPYDGKSTVGEELRIVCGKQENDADWEMDIWSQQESSHLKKRAMTVRDLDSCVAKTTSGAD